MFMFFPVMMLVSLLGTVAVGWRAAASRTAEINQDRRDYLRYLESVDARSRRRLSPTAFHCHGTIPEPAVLWSLVGSRRMWERRPDDADFGHVRVGAGFAGPVDPAGSARTRTGGRARPGHLDGTAAADPPPFDGAGSAGRAGTRRSSRRSPCDGDPTVCRSLLRAVICQLAVDAQSRTSADQRLSSIPLAAADWDWLKWLPHHQHPHAVDDGGPARMTYNSLASAEAALSRCGDGARAAAGRRRTDHRPEWLFHRTWAGRCDRPRGGDGVRRRRRPICACVLSDERLAASKR